MFDNIMFTVKHAPAAFTLVSNFFVSIIFTTIITCRSNMKELAIFSSVASYCFPESFTSFWMPLCTSFQFTIQCIKVILTYLLWVKISTPTFVLAITFVEISTFLYCKVAFLSLFPFIHIFLYRVWSSNYSIFSYS